MMKSLGAVLICRGGDCTPSATVACKPPGRCQHADHTNRYIGRPAFIGGVDCAGPARKKKEIKIRQEWNRTAGEWVQTKIFAPYWGFFSTGHFAGHERKSGRDFKDIFSEPYRESNPVWSASNGCIRESSKLRARIIAIFFNQLVQFSERHFASAVLVAMMVRFRPHAPFPNISWR